MLFLAKLFGVLSLVWFYSAAKKHGGPPLQWPIIGLIGYWLTWWLSKMLLVVPLTSIMPKHSVAEFLVTQLPVLCGIGCAF
jgi:hypothetical protein